MSSLIKQVVKANKSLEKEKLVIFTWGNASARTSDNKMYIKPSGVPFKALKTKNISVVDLENSEHVSGLKPSVDSPTHIELYKNFNGINGIVHTHSKYCTIFAQARKAIPCVGTTHADYFYGDIPVVHRLTKNDIETNYEQNTGLKIVEYFKEYKLCYKKMKAALCPGHGVFVWGKDIKEAIKNAIIIEHIAEMAYKTVLLYNLRNKNYFSISKDLLDKHFLRKHGNEKYYGQ